MQEPTAIIMGYGVPPDIMRDGNYGKYLTEALRTVILPNSVRQVILCGGATNIHYPEKTEAGEMQRYLAHKLPKAGGAEFKLVARSITGRENLEGAAKILHNMQSTGKVFIICEKSRRAKVWLTAKLVLPPDQLFEVVGIDFDATRNWRKDWKQYLGVAVVAVEHVFPKLRQLTRKRQLRHITRVSQK